MPTPAVDTQVKSLKKSFLHYFVMVENYYQTRMCNTYYNIRIKPHTVVYVDIIKFNITI